MTQVETRTALILAALFKSGLKSLFKRAAIFSATFLVLIYISSPLSGAAATPNPAGFDILRMKLGMSVAQIEAAIKAHDPSLKIIVIEQPLYDKRFADHEFVQIVHAAGLSTDSPERISVGFTVTQPSRAFFIGRRTIFPLDKRPLVEKTAQQLREKYGPESMLSNNRFDFDWVFDKAGKQIVASVPLFQTCAHLRIPNLYTFLNYYSAGFGVGVGAPGSPAFYSPECGVGLKASFTPGSSNPNLVSALDEQLVGDSIAADDIQKLMADAKAVQEQQRQQQERKAAGVKPSL
jgi:hypothetical protein